MGYSSYPNSIDNSSTLPLATDKVTEVRAEVVNRLRSAVINIQSELGVQPSATFGTVKDRLDNFDGNINDVYNELEVIKTLLLSLPETGGGGIPLFPIQVSLPVTSPGQTSFSLVVTPYVDDGVQMYRNGQKLERDTDYTSSGNSVTYLGTYPLQTSDVIEFYYLYTDSPLSSSKLPSKIRVYNNANTSLTTAPAVFTTASWDAESLNLNKVNASYSGTDVITNLIGTHTYLVSGQLGLEVVSNSVDSITIEILKNGTSVHKIEDYGSTWTISQPRTFSFYFLIDLTYLDALSVRWTHTGSISSETVLLTGDDTSWISISRI